MNKKLQQLAIPIIIQNLLSFLSTSLDSLMMTQLDPLTFSAVMMANQVFLVVSLINGGITGSLNVLVSQYYGRRDYKSIRTITGNALFTALILIGLIEAACFLFPEMVMSLLSNDEKVIMIASRYLRLVSISYLPYALSSVVYEALKAIHEVKFPVRLAIMTMACNGVLNYVLIFGNCGFAAYGVDGAAIATLIARIIELACVSVYLGRKGYFTKSEAENDRSLITMYLKTAVPVIANELLWAFGDSILLGFVGRISREALEVYSIFTLLGQAASIINNGLISAVCIYLGNLIGSAQDVRGEMKMIRRVSLLSALTAGAIICLYIPFLGPVNHLQGDTLILARMILLEGMIIQPFSCLQSLNTMGILRGFGDIRFGFYNDIIFLYLYTIPLVWVLIRFADPAFVFLFPIIRSDQVIKFFTSDYRIASQLKKGPIHSLTC